MLDETRRDKKVRGKQTRNRWDSWPCPGETRGLLLTVLHVSLYIAYLQFNLLVLSTNKRGLSWKRARDNEGPGEE